MGALFRFVGDVRWVGQTDPLGCGCAALAMILGTTYEQVKADFAEKRDFSDRGLNYQDIDDYLACRGIATARKWVYRLSQMREEWPPVPFGDLHLCVVMVAPTSPCTHFVLMRGDGRVLDPATPELKRLTDYHSVQNVAAVVN